MIQELRLKRYKKLINSLESDLSTEEFDELMNLYNCPECDKPYHKEEDCIAEEYGLYIHVCPNCGYKFAKNYDDEE